MAMRHLWSLLLCHWVAARGSPTACMDGNGNAVDFWYIFCHPQGTSYTYADSNHLTLTPAPNTLKDDSSALARTLKQAYQSGIAYAMWNDEAPTGRTSSSPYAHAKGVVAFDSAGGFWLTHSLPKFPQVVAKGYDSSWEVAAEVYGQSYLCLSLDTANIKVFGDGMSINRPSVYDVNVPSFADQAVPNFRDWTSGKYVQSPTSVVQTVKTRGGRNFGVFSKSADFGMDLYSELVAPHIGQDLITETWQRGTGDLPDVCKGDSQGHKFSVMTSEEVSFPSASWKDMQDHSKWAVTEQGTVICVGDINRQSGQFKRGGGTVCLEDSGFAGQMRKAVTSYKQCGSSSSQGEIVV